MPVVYSAEVTLLHAPHTSRCGFYEPAPRFQSTPPGQYKADRCFPQVDLSSSSVRLESREHACSAVMEATRTGSVPECPRGSVCVGGSSRGRFIRGRLNNAPVDRWRNQLVTVSALEHLIYLQWTEHRLLTWMSVPGLFLTDFCPTSPRTCSRSSDPCSGSVQTFKMLFQMCQVVCPLQIVSPTLRTVEADKTVYTCSEETGKEVKSNNVKLNKMKY